MVKSYQIEMRAEIEKILHEMKMRRLETLIYPPLLSACMPIGHTNVTLARIDWRARLVSHTLEGSQKAKLSNARTVIVYGE